MSSILDPATPSDTPAAPARRLSDHAIRTGCVAAALAVLVVIDLLPLSFRWPGPMAWLAVMLEIGIGVAAALLLDRGFGRWSFVAALGLSAIVVFTAFSVPDDYAWIVDVLTWTPFMMLLTLGALAAIPHELFEAAAIDRAGAWFELGNLTMPLIAPLLLGGIVFRVVDTFGASDSLQFVILAYALLIAAIGTGELVVRYRRALRRGSSQ